MPKISIVPYIAQKLRMLIGINQDGDTATRAIAQGKYVVWKGNLCTADAAIAIGDTLKSSGTEKNLTVVDDGGLNALNTVSSNKADKVSSATNGNFAGLDANGNLTDSGNKASDFAVPGDIPSVINNLTSDSTTDALSAAQGKALNSSIDHLGYDIGTKTVSAFQTDIETKIAALSGHGKSFTFKVDFSDSVSPLSSGAHTGIATRNTSGRVNVILQRSGSSVNSSYLGCLTSSGWVWNQIAINSDSLILKNLATHVTAVDYNALDEGLYYNQEVGSNCPTTTGYMVVMSYRINMGVVAQIAFDLYSNSSRIFFRTKTASVWRDWQELTPSLKQNKLKVTNFTGTTDSYGNITLKDSNGNAIDQNHAILSVATSIGYCTQPVLDNGGWAVKVLTGTGSTVTAKTSTQATFYITYT